MDAVVVVRTKVVVVIAGFVARTMSDVEKVLVVVGLVAVPLAASNTQLQRIGQKVRTTELDEHSFFVKTTQLKWSFPPLQWLSVGLAGTLDVIIAGKVAYLAVIWLVVWVVVDVVVARVIFVVVLVVVVVVVVVVAGVGDAVPVAVVVVVVVVVVSVIVVSSAVVVATELVIVAGSSFVV